jgi:hypothetical protein
MVANITMEELYADSIENNANLYNNVLNNNGKTVINNNFKDINFKSIVCYTINTDLLPICGTNLTCKVGLIYNRYSVIPAMESNTWKLKGSHSFQTTSINAIGCTESKGYLYVPMNTIRTGSIEIRTQDENSLLSGQNSQTVSANVTISMQLIDGHLNANTIICYKILSNISVFKENEWNKDSFCKLNQNNEPECSNEMTKYTESIERFGKNVKKIAGVSTSSYEIVIAKGCGSNATVINSLTMYNATVHDVYINSTQHSIILNATAHIGVEINSTSTSGDLTNCNEDIEMVSIAKVNNVTIQKNNAEHSIYVSIHTDLIDENHSICYTLSKTVKPTCNVDPLNDWHASCNVGNAMTYDKKKDYKSSMESRGVFH